MTINIDDRSGSANLFPFFPKNTAKLTHLEYGDFSFIGNGPDGIPITVGIERKAIHDALNSMSSGRMQAVQIPGLIASYNVIFIIIEGIYRPDPDNGIIQIYRAHKWMPLEHGKRRWMYTELQHFLTTLTMICNFHVERTSREEETAKLVLSLYQWFTKKEWSKHKSHLAMRSEQLTNVATIYRPGIVQRMARQIDGIGEDRCVEVGKVFKTPREMCNAEEKDWLKIPKIGRVLAKQTVETIREGDK